MKNVTEACARWALALSYGAIPSAVVHEAKRSILDCVGVSLAGSTIPVGHIAIEYVRSLRSVGEASVLTAGFKTDLASAAFANGILAHALDWDDEWESPTGHPTCSALPAALAVAEKRGSTGKDLLTAFIAGLEVHGKIGARGRAAGFHNTGVFGVLGAAIAAAKLLGLDEWQTRMALGIAASHASGLGVNIGTMTKPYHAGNAAAGGLRAALLAGAGFMADPKAIEGSGRTGFGPTFMGEAFDPEFTATALGSPYHLIEPGMSLKRYPACYMVQGATDAVLQLVREHAITPNNIEEVVVHSPALDNPDPDQGHRAKFSLQYTVAAAILDRQIVVESFEEERVHAPDVREFMKRVRLEPDGQPRHPPVNIRLTDGRQLGREVWPHGDIHDRFSDEEVFAKYRNAASRVLSPADCEGSLELVMNLEKQASIRELAEIVTKVPATVQA